MYICIETLPCENDRIAVSLPHLTAFLWRCTPVAQVRSSVGRVLSVFSFFCITSKSRTLLHIHISYCILVNLLLIGIITTITIALVFKK